jgi:oligosaccharide repeat unit polymerase
VKVLINHISLIKLLYFSPPALAIWPVRIFYIGIIISAVWLHSSFFGEFNLLYPVNPFLKYASLLGLCCFDAGVIIGWYKIKREVHIARSTVNWFRTNSWLVPMFLWLMGILGSIILFTKIGVPLFSDPMLRALIGFRSGIWKRVAYIYMPVSCVEIYALSLNRKCPFLVSMIVIAITLLTLALFTKKGPIVFTLLFLFIVPYSIYNKASFKMRSKFFLRVTIIILVTYFLIWIGLRSEVYGVSKIMLVRITNLIAQSPNYILSSDTASLISRDDLIRRELRAIGGTFRISERPEQLDTSLTRLILKRDIEHGGLNPTVIGYGWIIGRTWGIVIMSLLYGFIISKFYRSFLIGKTACQVSCSLFGMYIVFGAIQVFSPVDVFLDNGLSLISYIWVHRLLSEVLGIASSKRSRNTMRKRKILNIKADKQW